MWQPGEVIVRRDVWRGRPYFGVPVIVVRDEPELLAVYLPEGAPFDFPEGAWPAGEHPWEHRARWQGHGIVMLHRPGAAHAVWVFWKGVPRKFSHWYINLQAPFRRTRIGFDTLDHTLDLWSEDGVTWHVKDDQMLDERVTEGLFTAEEAAAIRGDAARFRDEVRAEGLWWDEAWADWLPDPRWPAPNLPDGWERYLAAS